MKIYLVNENYDNGESYEEHYYYDDAIGVFDSKEGAQDLIDHIFEIEKQRRKGFIEVLPENFEELDNQFYFGSYHTKDSSSEIPNGRVYICDNDFNDDDTKEMHQFYITEHEMNQAFGWYKMDCVLFHAPMI